MAKRKRLTPPQADYFDGPAPETKAMFPLGVAPAPISRVTGDAAAAAALREVAAELTAARSEGRLVQRLALHQIDAAWLVRDRLGSDAEELDSLIASLRRHGQRTPIEVTELPSGQYGLISGWRRITALRQLHSETDDARFGTVLAVLRRHGLAEDAYVAMVEENEIRLGLSYWERARIAAKSVEVGIFASEKIALQRLFAAASRSKRSKIGSFLGLYHSLQDLLRFPTALPERLGLALARGIEADPGLGLRLAEALRGASPDSAPDSAEAEQALLAAALKNPAAVAMAPARPAQVSGAANPDRRAPVPPSPPSPPEGEEIRPGLFLATRGERLILSGPALGPAQRQRLESWIKDGGLI